MEEKSNHKILIIGNGFLGKLINASLTLNGRDTVLIKQKQDIDNDHNECDAVIICVPVPVIEGVCNTDALDHAVDSIQKNLPHAPVLVKSTITPDIAKSLPENYVYNPNFLDHNATVDNFHKHQNFVLLGGPEEQCGFWHGVFEYLESDFVYTDQSTASWCKYIHNIFMSAKKLVFDEMKRVSRQKNSEHHFNQAIDITRKYNRMVGSDYLKLSNYQEKFGLDDTDLLKDFAAFEEYSGSELVKILNYYNEILKNESTRSK